MIFKPRRKCEWVGMLVRLRRDVRTIGGTAIPKGTLAVVTDSYGGLGVQGAQCASCGVSVHVRKLEPADLEAVERLLPVPDARRPALSTSEAVSALKKWHDEDFARRAQA